MIVRHHPIECIIPPHMLEQIAEKGTPQQRNMAVQTIQQTRDFRAERQAVAARERAEPDQAVPQAEQPAKNRVVYTANFGSNLPGQVVRSEGDPASGDPAVDEAYDGAGHTYDLYWNIYQRNSIDNQGMRIDSTVHYMRSYDNAFWDGNQMVYGDGDSDLPPDQQLFNRFTIALDVIGHELAHGVTQYTGNLNYSFQAGAMNESFSDVFGSLVKQYLRQQDARSADWIIGEGLFTANVNGFGIRSMKEPGTAYNDPILGKDPQPGHMSDYVNTIEDNGGVHINSGIPNRAFYLTAYELGSFAWEKAGNIWYATLCNKIQPSTNFQQAASMTYDTAGELYGQNSLEQQAVRTGWLGVGIQVGGSEPEPNPQPTGCLPGLLKMLGIGR